MAKYFNTSFQEWREWNPDVQGVFVVRTNIMHDEHKRELARAQARANGFTLPQLAMGSSGNPHYTADEAWSDLWSIRQSRAEDKRPWIKAWVESLIVVKAPCVFSRRDCHIPQAEPTYLFGVRQYSHWTLKDYVQVFCLATGNSATDRIWNQMFIKRAWATAHRLNAAYRQNKVGVIRLSLRTGLVQCYLTDPLTTTIYHPKQGDERMWFFRGDRDLNDVWQCVEQIARTRYHIEIKTPSCPSCKFDAASQLPEVTNSKKVEYTCMECGCEFHLNEYWHPKINDLLVAS
jgi:hypothetical protein